MRHRLVHLSAKAFIVCFLAASVLSGCRTYRDPLLDAAGKMPCAVLIHHSFNDDVILNIDGHAPRTASSRFELMPGKHSILLGLNEGFYVGDNMKIDFEVRAGETYHAKHHVKPFGGSWTAWIVEDSTGKRFEGVRSPHTRQPFRLLN
jgi:hypothetical protein